MVIHTHIINKSNNKKIKVSYANFRKIKIKENYNKYIFPKNTVFVRDKKKMVSMSIRKASGLLKKGKIKRKDIFGQYQETTKNLVSQKKTGKRQLKLINEYKNETKVYRLKPADHKNGGILYKFLKKNNITGSGILTIRRGGKSIYSKPHNIGLSLNKWWQKKAGWWVGAVNSDHHIWNETQSDPTSEEKSHNFFNGNAKKGGIKYKNPQSLNNDVSFYWTTNKKIKPLSLIQVYRKSETNFCFFDAIENHVEDFINSKKKKDLLNKVIKYKKKFTDGVNWENIKLIAEDMRINITIKDIFNKFETHKYKINNSKYHIKLLNSQCDHLEINNFINTEEIGEISQDEINEIMMSCYSNNEWFYFIGSEEEPKYLLTKAGKYKVLNERNNIIKDFNKSIDINRFKIDTVKEKIKFEYIHRLVNFNAHCMFPEKQDFVEKHTEDELSEMGYIEYDIKKAYTQYKKCDYYLGFPTKMTNPIKLTNWTMKQVKKYVGYYTVKIIDIKNENTKKIMNALNLKIDYHYGFTSPMILFLNDNDVKMDIKAGSFCFKSFNFDFTKEMIENKAYQIYAGKLHSYTPSTTLSTFSNHNLASDLACHYDEVELRALDNKDYDIVNVILNNDTVYNYSHIGGYITSYNRINTFQELFKLNYDDILGFKCDGFICKNATINISKSSMWDIKQIVKNFSWGDVLYYELEDDNSNDLLDYGTKPKNNLDNSLLGIDGLYTKQYIALSGAGGSGKTTTTAKQYPEMLFIANNWRLITQKIDEHKIEGNTIHKLIGLNCDKYDGCPSVIFYDEINTYSAAMIKKAIKLYPYSQHILCGDFEKVNNDIIYYQCSNTMDGLFTSFKNFDIHHFDKNYRTNDQELLNKLNGLRDVMKSSKMNINKIKEFVLTHFKKYIVNEDYLIKNYDYKTDTVLCSVTNGKRSQTEYYSKLLDGKKYLCINHNKNHLQKKLNGDKNVLLKGDILIKPDGKILKRFEQRDAFTIHSVQGLTLKTGTLYIIFNRIFCPAQLYTALSRVTHLSQIKILA